MKKFKNLFLVDDEDNKPSQTPMETNNISFPLENNISFPLENDINMVKNDISSSNEYINDTIEIYEKGFESLNQTNFDFYEFHQLICNGDINNPQTYTMAFAMSLAMDNNITKEKLINEANFYISEIMKFYNQNIEKGNKRKEDLISAKTLENKTLTDELNYYKEQWDIIKNKIIDRENKLASIENNYKPQFDEIGKKLTANEIGKNKIIKRIETIKTGINNNIK